MSKSNDRKSQFLGMPHGTANGRLRKNILFKYIKLANHHFCYKCGLEIESVNDLSIEHIKPWEGRDVELFWDLGNIAFSHLMCNTPHTTRRTIVKEGYSFCSTCKETKLLEDFYKNDKRWNGVYHECKQCSRKRAIEYKARRKGSNNVS